MINESGFGEQWDRLANLHKSADELLAGLDELALHQAAAYVSMAIDAMRQARPDLQPPD